MPPTVVPKTEQQHQRVASLLQIIGLGPTAFGPSPSDNHPVTLAAFVLLERLFCIIIGRFRIKGWSIDLVCLRAHRIVM